MRDRQVGYDCRWLLACLTWGTMAGDGEGGTLLERNPLRGLPVPREESPARPMLLDEMYRALLAVAPAVSPQFALALVLANETGHRLQSVRHLRWSDVDLDRASVSWRAEHDKIGLGHVTPLTPAAVTVLGTARRAAAAIGDAWIFPGARKPHEPTSRHTFAKWWARAAELADVEPGARAGYHSLRRKFATELKRTPLKDLAALGGWKSIATLLECYQAADWETMRGALAARQSIAAAGR